MAAMLETSQNKGSDLFYDLCCSVCDDDGINKEGLFYCQKCSKTYCDECVFMHNKVLKNHPITAKGDGDNWPVTKTDGDTLELCEKHSSEKLTMFCDDHEKLLCQLCLFNNHRQCSHVVLLAEKCKSSTKHIDVAEMASNMERLQKRLVEAVKSSEQNIKSLQTSHEIILEEILDFRRQMNDSLDRLQQHTVNELDKLHSSLKKSIEDKRKQCETFIPKLKLHDAKSRKSPDKSFILCRKYLDQIASAELFLKNAPNADIEFQHNNDLEQFLAACKDLGKITSRVVVVSHQHVDPNKVINVQGKSQFKVRTNTDSYSCTITGICEMSNGNIVISDFDNQCVKLLDQAYSVIDQVKLPSKMWSMCNISPNDIAATVSEYLFSSEIHFLRVDNRNIIKIKNLQLNHSCYGIAHHKGDLFGTSRTALFQYATDGRLVKKLYEDKSELGSVAGVAVSPDGKRIYVTDTDKQRLVILTRDGAVTAMLQDPAFTYSKITSNIHVAATGQVFVFGNTSVSQVDTDGKKILAKFNVDGLPGSVYFNVCRSKLIVGTWDNDGMTEFKTTIK